MNLSLALEKFRYVIFMEKEPPASPDMSQEQYLESYEQQIERNPAVERILMAKYSAPILPVYRKHIEQIAKMERLLTGESETVSFSDQDVLEELYDEISNLDTEEEWQAFKKTLVDSKS